MEEVEGANRAAVESRNKVLNMMSKPEPVAQDELMYRNMMLGTRETVGKFRKVVSLLGRTVGHARARMSKNLPKVVKFGSDKNPNVDHQAAGSFLTIKQSGPIVARSVVCSDNPSLSLEIGLNYNNQAAQVVKPEQVTSLQQRHLLLQHQRLQQHNQLMNYRFQQQQQAEMMFNGSYCHSGISLNFENSSCTPTMSSNGSFMSSLSMDGSIANVNRGDQ